MENANPELDIKTKTSPVFKTVLYNDETHTYDYVVEMLTHVCKLSKENAFRCAVEVDTSGRTIVHYGALEDCKHIAQQILSYGPDHRLPHSLKSMEADVEN